MKLTLFLLIFFLSNINCYGTVGNIFNKFVHTNTGAAVGTNDKFLIDEYNNKFHLNLYKHTASFGNITVAPTVQLNYTYFYSWSYFIAKFDSLDNFNDAATLFSGDTVLNVTSSYYEGHFYVLLNYRGKIYTSHDSLVSAGGNDIGLLKFNSNFDLVGKLNIGGIQSETTSNENLEVKNGIIYIGGNFASNNQNNTYLPYSLVIGNDTLHCDNLDSNSKTEYFVSIIDTNLNPIKSKSGGGLNDNFCTKLKVIDSDIYLLVQTNSNTKNNALGIWFNYVTAVENKFYLLKLDANLNAKWMRKFGITATDFIMDLKLTTTQNALLVTGITDRTGSTFGGGGYGGGGGGTIPNRVIMDLGPNLAPNSKFENDNFSFGFVYDTAGQFKWTSNLIPIKDAAYDAKTNKVIIVGTRSGHSSIGGDTLINCGSFDSYLASINMDSASIKLFDKICGTREDLLKNITISKANKIYTSGSSNSGMLEFTTFNQYLNFGVYNLFYARIDSIDYFPLQILNSSYSNEISIYPNPSSTFLYIKSPTAFDKKTSISIVDITGRKMELSNIEFEGNTTIKIPLGTWAKGTYFLNVKTVNETKTFQFRVE